ncbi:hypothetical protein MO973_20775 [Paenibacillus sp. TRM 82003]|nr:hypothetical protein [Paenibacillus sp. TRM 82003]
MNEVNDSIDNPHAYLKALHPDDIRWNKFNVFWNINSTEPYRNQIHSLRKQRSKQIIIAILNGCYTKGNIKINADQEERVITFRYRGTIIGRFDLNIVTFMPAYTGTYESASSTIGQRKSVKDAIKELLHVMLGNDADNRISRAYREFLELTFNTMPQHPCELWVSREAYVNAMNFVEAKYKLKVGDPDFLEWRLTLLGRSPMILEEE